MTTRELIHAAIENVPEEDVDDLYRLIREFAEAKQPHRESGALSRLKRIKIRAPEDFAANHEQYASGEKQIASDQDVR